MDVNSEVNRTRLRGSDASFSSLACLPSPLTLPHTHEKPCRKVRRDSKSLETTLRVASCPSPSRSWSCVVRFPRLLIDVKQGATTLPAGADRLKTCAQAHGISLKDCEKLTEAGYATLEAVAYTPKKLLCQVKGISEAKADKIITQGAQIMLYRTGRGSERADHSFVRRSRSQQDDSDGLYDCHRVVSHAAAAPVGGQAGMATDLGHA